MTYLILFISAFASATLLPLGSEALLIYNIKEGFNIYALLLIATSVNIVPIDSISIFIFNPLSIKFKLLKL